LTLRGRLRRRRRPRQRLRSRKRKKRRLFVMPRHPEALQDVVIT